MNIVKTEKIELSENEMNAFLMVQNCLNGILKEATNPNIRNWAMFMLEGVYEMPNYIMDDEVEVVEEPAKEHSWDERHTPSMFELNP